MIRRRAVAGALLCSLAGGCVYLNSVYNARQRFEDGERARIEGRAEDAEAAYADAARKAAASFRKAPDGSWADDALYVLGRAYLRQRDFARAIPALEEALARADDENVRRGATLYLGVAHAEVGDRARARPLLDSAVLATWGRDLVGEAFYWRARLSFSENRDEEGFADLARAEAIDPDLRVPVRLERLARAVVTHDPRGAFSAATELLTDPRAAVRADSIAALARRVERDWGAAAAAEFLGPARAGDWPPGPRDRLLLQRLEVLARAGDTLAAESEAGWVSQGTTPGAEAARLLVSEIRLHRAEEVTDLDAIRRVLLPSGGTPAVAALATDIRRVELLNEWAVDEPEAWFVAAEVARDRLGAPRLARGLFLRFASEAPESPWSGKAVLAALATTPEPRSDPALRAGLEARAGDPYVARALGDAPPEPALEELEARLSGIVEDLLARADAEALRRDLFLRGADTLGPTPGRGGGS